MSILASDLILNLNLDGTVPNLFKGKENFQQYNTTRIVLYAVNATSFGQNCNALTKNIIIE